MIKYFEQYSNLHLSVVSKKFAHKVDTKICRMKDVLGNKKAQQLQLSADVVAAVAASL